MKHWSYLSLHNLELCYRTKQQTSLEQIMRELSLTDQNKPGINEIMH